MCGDGEWSSTAGYHWHNIFLATCDSHRRSIIARPSQARPTVAGHLEHLLELALDALLCVHGDMEGQVGMVG